MPTSGAPSILDRANAQLSSTSSTESSSSNNSSTASGSRHVKIESNRVSLPPLKIQKGSFPAIRQPTESSTHFQSSHSVSNAHNQSPLNQSQSSANPVTFEIADEPSPSFNHSFFEKDNARDVPQQPSHSQNPSSSSSSSSQSSQHSTHLQFQIPSNEKKSLDDPSPRRKPSFFSKSNLKRKYRYLKNPDAWNLPPSLQFIPKNLNRKGLKPVIRAAINSWIAFLLVLARHTNRVLGMSSFFVVITSILVPAMEPIAPMLWKTLFQFLLLFSAYAWTVLAAKLATVARGSPSREASLAQAVSEGFVCPDPSQGFNYCIREAVFQGYFVRPLPSIIWALFEFSAVALFIRLKMKYPPLNFPCVFSIICTAVSANMGPMYPYFYPRIGLFFIVPNCVQTGITIGCTLFILPETCNHAYNTMLCKLTEDTSSFLKRQTEMLSHSPASSHWASFSSLENEIANLKNLLSKMKSTELFLDMEFSYGRLKGEDLVSIQRIFKKTILRLSAFSYFQRLIDHNMQIYDDETIQKAGEATVSSWLNTPALSAASARTSSGRNSSESDRVSYFGLAPVNATTQDSERNGEEIRRLASKQLNVPVNNNFRTVGYASPSNASTASFNDIVQRGRSHVRTGSNNSEAPLAAKTSTTKRNGDLLEPQSPSLRSHKSRLHLPSSLGKFYKKRKKSYKPVGVLEAQQYLALESRLPFNKPQFLDSLLSILKNSSGDLFDQAIYSLDALNAWLVELNHDRLKKIFSKRDQKAAGRDRLKLIKLHYDHLSQALHEYEREKCFDVRKPYESLFQNQDVQQFYMHSLRSLFVVYYYESHLMQAVRGILQILETVIDLEERRPIRRLWWPLRSIRRSLLSQLTGHQGDYDENIHNDVDKDMNQSSTQPRDPDADHPSSLYHICGYRLTKFFKSIFRPMNVFVLKVGTLAVICTIPAFCRSSAGWYYRNRGLWAVILAIMSLQRFTADTVYGYLMRIFGTFFGAILGMVIWYTGSGHGLGNAYGLAAVWGAAIPFIQFIRVHFVILTPMPAVIFCVTAALTVTYSWKSNHEPGVVTLGIGWDVAYRRFLTVAAGITVAFIFSFLPQPRTAKYAVRKNIGNTLIDIGSIHCEISNFARRPVHNHIDPDIQSKVLNLSNTIQSLIGRLNMVNFEPSFKGRWPMEKYQLLCKTQLELVDLLNSLMTTITTLEDRWLFALLYRVGWLDHKFVADQLAVLYMSSNALQTGNPLPQVVPSPLVDRFFTTSGDVFLPPGLNDAPVPIPKAMEYELLNNMQYLNFAVGCTIAYAVVNHIDRIMFITKSLCGEIFEIDEWPFHFDDEYLYTCHPTNSPDQRKSPHDLV